MAVFENCTLKFPHQPPPRAAKPDFKKGQRPRPADKYSLWGSHDPAIFRDPVTENYYTYCTGAIARRSLGFDSLGECRQGSGESAA